MVGTSGPNTRPPLPPAARQTVNENSDNKLNLGLSAGTATMAISVSPQPLAATLLPLRQRLDLHTCSALSSLERIPSGNLPEGSSWLKLSRICGIVSCVKQPTPSSTIGTGRNEANDKRRAPLAGSISDRDRSRKRRIDCGD